MYQRIIVPLDGSELAEAALPHAQYFAQLMNTPLHIVRVVDTSVAGRYDAYGMAAGYMSTVDVFDVDRQEAEEYLSIMRPRLAAHGLVVTAEKRTGQVARELVAAAHADDLIVMTSHGRSGLARWFMGSVAEEVIRHATSPVLLIRMDAAALHAQQATAEPAKVLTS